ncbi:GAF domain-containing SpoIIE family protein phosphatase [Atopobium fossor]|uniref:GAF domain-containing SpoIIE family protein phosphatase n=1 Tax=Atopobium fossor TaxID=39487 RepID=UPI00040FFE33|nr:GAF domain-containing SpoIIE family protein phosphatase [Atopobium fossor]
MSEDFQTDSYPSTSIERAYSVGSGITAPATLARMLDITSNGVIVFASTGVVLFSNERAAHMLGVRSLIGRRVDEFMYPAQSLGSQATVATFVPPFATDGSTCSVVARHSNGGDVFLTIRCDEISAPGNNYLLIMEPSSLLAGSGNEQTNELVSELRGANRRLSGVLNIVLETLDWSDVATLFTNVLEQLRDTMEATGTLLYLAESDGLVLRGTTASMETLRVPKYLSLGEGMELHAIAAGKAIRVQLLSPEKEDLRAQNFHMRRVLNEETNETFSISVRALFPFASSILVPVWFAERVIALIVVGWERSRSLRRDDARLLDSVAQYLSVQLMGALTDLRTQHRARLDGFVSSLHDRMSDKDSFTGADVGEMFRSACEQIETRFIPLEVSEDGMLSVYPTNDAHRLIGSLPVQLSELCELSSIDEVAATSLMSTVAGNKLSAWLEDQGVENRGAFVYVGTLAKKNWAYLALRSDEYEPLEDIEIAFLRNVSTTLKDGLASAKARTNDKRIAQALQLGMRNELQKVEGIFADGIYSSATADAFVGGDFYDLIRLPGHRACVILGDVSGHGVEAASVSAAVKTALGAYAWQGLNPARMVRTLNRFLLGFSRLETFATLFVGVIDLARGKLTYCSAGHPPALLVRTGTQTLDVLDVQSGVVGAFEEMSYRDGQVNIGQGDTLLLYTDGVTEARNPEGVFFGERNLQEATLREAMRGSEGMLNRLLETLDRYTARRLEDDVAMVELTFTQIGEQ